MNRSDNAKIEIKNLTVYSGDRRVLNDINMAIKRNSVTAVVGPAESGKTTLLRSLNLMNEIIEDVRVSGEILVDGVNIQDGKTTSARLRKRIGLVFQRPTVFPKSVYENVAYGPKIHGVKGKAELDEIVRSSLEQAALWREVEDRLRDSALKLNDSQRQRLCIARALAVEPEILLLDEPSALLDPVATQRIEDMIQSLKERYTVAFVTNNLQQAARISDYTAFIYMGELVEHGPTKKLFTNPDEIRTEEYINGRFG